jgi:Holliday junction resolvasome RuvABC endonuclease subunit
MMSRPLQQRILAIAPITKGFGFAVLDGEGMLVNWGTKRVTRNKNQVAFEKVKKLITDYRPDLLVFEDTTRSRRAPRICVLLEKISAWALNEKVKVRRFSIAKVQQVFFPHGQGTKDDLAAMVARRFPESLEHELPPRRRPWMSEDARMGIFIAVALALMPKLRKRKSRGIEAH